MRFKIQPPHLVIEAVGDGIRLYSGLGHFIVHLHSQRWSVQLDTLLHENPVAYLRGGGKREGWRGGVEGERGRWKRRRRRRRRNSKVEADQ